jgi:tetratricopeptide (TPR) repeat protein
MDCSLLRRWGLYLLLVSVSLSGCAHRAPWVVADLPGDLPSRMELTGVPFFPQQAYQCGPAALATVLNETGLQVSPEEIAEEIFTPAKKGSFQLLMVGAAREHGRLPYVIEGFDALVQEVAAGNPVVVLQNLGLDWLPKWHYAVVVGYDLQERKLILRSGGNPRKVMAWALFYHTWKRADDWGMVVLPPGRLPASAGEIGYLQAAAALEQIGRPREAAASYAAALGRWPSSLAAAMGLGNSRYAAGQLREAEEAFRTAIEIDPENGDAYNNLAMALARQNRFEEAEKAVLEAIRLGGPNRSYYRETLEEIRARETRGSYQE